MAVANLLDPSRESEADFRGDPPESLTLLELVYGLSAIAKDDRSVVKAVVKMLSSGKVQLRGNFRGDPIEDFDV